MAFDNVEGARPTEAKSRKSLAFFLVKATEKVMPPVINLGGLVLSTTRLAFVVTIIKRINLTQGLDGGSVLLAKAANRQEYVQYRHPGS